jgi:hypothetical protein
MSKKSDEKRDSHRLLGMTGLAVMMAFSFARPSKAFLHGPFASFRSNRALFRTMPRPIFMSTSATNMEELQEKIRLKGDEIRQLKADGIDKSALAPYVAELVSLKSQLPQEPPTLDKASSSKPKKLQQNQTKKQSSAAKGAPEAELTISELRANRLAKVDVMRLAGFEPFDYSYQTTHTAMQLAEQYDGKLEPGEDDTEMVEDVSVAGRIMTRRVFGKLAFFTVQDESGLMQIQFDTNRLGDSFQVGF